MDKSLIDYLLANAIPLIGVGAAWWNIRVNQRTHAEAEKIRQQILAKEIADKMEERHDENHELLTNIRIRVEGLQHLDPCLDDLKKEVRELTRRFSDCFRQNARRG